MKKWDKPEKVEISKPFREKVKRLIRDKGIVTTSHIVDLPDTYLLKLEREVKNEAVH